ncbi:MAG: YggS family pyridoxal phosphate-dependent enzyme [Flavobacteriaceae bacterium]|nr:YggS family pyridoxal phosphate-dependent enzyme [Flavobacteriaceae bacterium]
MSITENLDNLKNDIGDQATLVAVSKTKPAADILEAYHAGQRIFGENKIQEMTRKWEELPKDIEWHMIGSVQRNKVKYMAVYVSLIHGVNSLKLLNEINKQARKHDRVISCLLQIKIAEEDSKQGMSAEDARALLASEEFVTMKHVKICGLMGMATFTSDENQLRREFNYLNTIFVNLKQRYPEIQVLSMGMSGDYQLAISEGSNMVRIGSSIFGARNYNI